MKFPVLSERQLVILSTILILIGLFLNLGVQPLYLEEPRRIMIALEMAENGQYIAPTELGDFYYKKPPIFNWLLLGSSAIFGRTEWAFRLPTVLSTFGMALLLWQIGKQYLSERVAIFTALLFVCCSGIFFYFSLLAEIDLFYSLVTLASLLYFFHFYQKGQYWWAFGLTYLLGLIGALTKGPPSVLFLGFTIVGYLGWKKDWKRLFSLAHISCGLLFVAGIGVFLGAYAQYHPIENFLQGLWGQSSEMTVLEESPSEVVMRTLRHFFSFPLSTMADILPGTLLLVFAVRRNFWQQVKANELILFSLLVFLVNIPVYMVSPGARQRYIYMLYPFLLYILVYFYDFYQTKKDWRWKSFRVVSGIILAVLPVGAIVLHFIPDLNFMATSLIPISIVGFVVLAALFWYYLKHSAHSLVLLIIGVAIARIIFDLTVLPQRAHDSDALREQIRAKELVELTKGAPIYIYERRRISFTTIVYLGLYSPQTVRRKYELEPDTFFLIDRERYLSDFPKEAYEVFTTVNYYDHVFDLVKFSEEELETLE
ncbi:MAG: glycosyltransferase family 39 protein [Bacteroidota bacterium]